MAFEKCTITENADYGKDKRMASEKCQLWQRKSVRLRKLPTVETKAYDYGKCRL